jgi:hypothetical protein
VTTLNKPFTIGIDETLTTIARVQPRLEMFAMESSGGDVTPCR